MSEVDHEGLGKLREPFPAESITKVPRGEHKDQTKRRCDVCGGWHHPVDVHLDAAGHAVVTDRLLSVDDEWQWEPCAWENGRPALEYDAKGSAVGLWIRLTVCGVTRLGYGSVGNVNDPVKELIGDALRNAAMRFGVALDLWGKAELESQLSGETADNPPPAQRPQAADSDGVKVASKRDRDAIVHVLNSITDREARTAAKREYLEHFGITNPNRLPADQVLDAIVWATERRDTHVPPASFDGDSLMAGIRAYEERLGQDAWPGYTQWLNDQYGDKDLDLDKMDPGDLEQVWRYLHELVTVGVPAAS